MNNEQKFWIIVDAIIGFVVVVIVIAIATYNIHFNSKITDLISKGYNPVAISCGFNDSSGKSPTCLGLINKE